MSSINMYQVESLTGVRSALQCIVSGQGGHSMRLAALLSLTVSSVLVTPGDSQVNQGAHHEVEEVQPRIFPLLPPYQGVDFLQNWNQLTTMSNAVNSLIKDTITVSCFNFIIIFILSKMFSLVFNRFYILLRTMVYYAIVL